MILLHHHIARHGALVLKVKEKKCQCEKPVKLRAAADDLRVHCDDCGQSFAKKGGDE